MVSGYFASSEKNKKPENTTILALKIKKIAMPLSTSRNWMRSFF
jgi:hypothetical protein